jgi:hypothetical protein
VPPPFGVRVVEQSVHRIAVPEEDRWKNVGHAALRQAYRVKITKGFAL